MRIASCATTELHCQPKPISNLWFDPRVDKWSRAGDSPLSRATVPVVEWQGRAVFPNGEVCPGRRTPEVWQLRLPQDQGNRTTPRALRCCWSARPDRAFQLSPDENRVGLLP